MQPHQPGTLFWFLKASLRQASAALMSPLGPVPASLLTQVQVDSGRLIKAGKAEKRLLVLVGLIPSLLGLHPPLPHFILSTSPHPALTYWHQGLLP